MIHIRPVNARTLLRPLPKEEIVLGSLILPDGGMGNLEEAIATADFNIVDAAGVTVLVTKGDKVIYPADAGIQQQVGGTYLKWVTIVDIWGIVTDEPAIRIDIDSL